MALRNARRYRRGGVLVAPVKLHHVAAADRIMDEIQRRYREQKPHAVGPDSHVVTRSDIARWCGVPVESVSIEDGKFVIEGRHFVLRFQPMADDGEHN